MIIVKQITKVILKPHLPTRLNFLVLAQTLLVVPTPLNNEGNILAILAHIIKVVLIHGEESLLICDRIQ